MQTPAAAVLIPMLLFSGCAALHPSKVNAGIPAAPAVQPAPVPPAVRVPIEWHYKTIKDWTAAKFPLEGDSVEIPLSPGDFIGGIVLNSTAETQGQLTSVLLFLDTNGNSKADEKVKVTIEDKAGSVAIKSTFNKIEE